MSVLLVEADNVWRCQHCGPPLILICTLHVQDVPNFNSNATEDGIRLLRMKNLKEHGVDVTYPITTMLHRELYFEFL